MTFEQIGGMAGQEAMTNRYVMGNSDSYDWNEQADIEETSVNGYASYKETDRVVSECIETLNNPNSTKDQIENAITQLSETLNNQYVTYEELEDKIAEQVERFEEETKTNKDDRSDGEISIANNIKDGFEGNKELGSINQKSAEELAKAIEDGEITNIKIEKTTRGDYVITYEAIKEMVIEQSKDGIFNTTKEINEALQARNMIDGLNAKETNTEERE